MRKIFDDRKGNVLVEFALALPIMVTILFGMIEGSQLLIAYMKLVDATGTIADLVAQQQTIASSDIDDCNAAAQYVMKPYAAAGLSFAVTSVTFDPSSGAASVAWQEVRNGYSPPADITTLAAGYGTKGESVIIVETGYAYNSLFHYVFPSKITLGETSFAKPRLVPSIPHT